MIVEVRHLETLQAIIQTGSLTRAAKRLSLTVSAVSHQLRELETLLGGQLIDRRNKPLRATPIGQRLLECAEQVLPQLHSAEADIAQLLAKQAERLYIAPECHSCVEWLLPALDALRETWPNLDVDLRLGPRFEPIPQLVSRDVDAVLSTDRVRHSAIAYDSVFRYEIVLVAPKGHAVASRSHIQPRDLSGVELLTYPVDLSRLDVFTRFLKPAGIKPKRGRTAELTSVLLKLVETGRGVAALPRWAVTDSASSPSLALVSLGKRGLWSEVFLATRKEEQVAPHLRAFLEIARRVARESLPGVEVAD